MALQQPMTLCTMEARRFIARRWLIRTKLVSCRDMIRLEGSPWAPPTPFLNPIPGTPCPRPQSMDPSFILISLIPPTLSCTLYPGPLNPILDPIPWTLILDPSAHTLPYPRHPISSPIPTLHLPSPTLPSVLYCTQSLILPWRLSAVIIACESYQNI